MEQSSRHHYIPGFSSRASSMMKLLYIYNMKRLLIAVIFFLILLPSLSAQKEKFVLMVDVEQNENSESSSFLVIHTEGHNFLIEPVLNTRNKFVLDTSLSHPQPISVHYYINCSQKEITDLNTYGDTEKSHPDLRFFMTESTTFLKVNRDTIQLLKPDLIQKRYYHLQSEVETRVASFNHNIGDSLIEAFKHAPNQKDKDSIEHLAGSLFKVNVARVNLDSSLLPVIRDNSDNSLSFYAIGEYMRVARILGLGIPKSQLINFLDSMPQKLKNYRVWTELYDNLVAMPANKTLVGSSAPPFKELKDTLGKEVHLKNFRNKLVFLDFWASWCVPCKKQLPELKRIYENLRNKQVEFIGVSLDFKSKDWKKEIKDSGLKWINVSDLKSNNGITSIMYNVTAIPHNVLIDANGFVIAENIPLDKLESKIKESL